MISTDVIDQLLSLGVLMMDVGLLVFFGIFIGFVLTRKTGMFWNNPLVKLIGKNGRVLAFMVIFAGVAGSLFFSNIVLLPPCELCWYQRVFLYPQLFIVGYGILKNDRRVGEYSILLSVIGIIIAIYHYYLQMGGAPFTTCGLGEVSCSEIQFIRYGFITIPVMSLTAFAAIIVSMVLYKKTTRS